MKTSKSKEPEPKVPADVRRAFTAAPKVAAKWKDLTPIARRDFITWIDGAKQPETHQRRIEKACSMLAAGKRRPCCYAVIPMDFYKVLGTNAKAKAQWRDLTPTERRDLIAQVDAIKEPKARIVRIKKVCSLLAAGKQRYASK